MKLLDGFARLIGLRPRRQSRGIELDLADMGTAFGLDAITTVVRDAPCDAATEAGAPRSALQRRLHRRSTF